MTKYFLASGGLHALAALCLMFALAPSSQKAQATYTIDFIGTGKVQAVTNQEAPAAKAPAETPKAAVAQPPQETPQEKPAEKPSKKAYASKAEISQKPKTAKQKAKEEAPLAAPSILDDTEETAKEASGGAESSTEGDFAGGNIQTDFADFPYPWYITQVRNSLWSEWEKRRPAGNVLSTMVTFAIARDGKVKNLKVERSSGDDSFDFSAKSSVLNAGPFAPLPMLFEKDELTITVEFRQEK